MSRIIAFIHLTLDGVMQAPGRPDEDRRGGFEHGGWAMPYNDGVMGNAVGESMGNTGALLFGRRTYEDFYKVWPSRTDSVARLRQQPGKDIVILGSGVLVQSLLRGNLVDELMLTIHPLVLGTGRRLFTGDAPSAKLRLVDSRTTTKGVVIATYQPDGIARRAA